MNVNLKKITLNDDLEGLELLKEITKTENSLYSSPVPIEINEYLYSGFLKLSEDERKEDKNFRYWILYNNKIVGYSDIKISKENNKRTGDIGLILSENNRGKQIGYEAVKLLLQKAKEDAKVDIITITTSVKNIPMQKLCSKIGAILIDKEDNYKYKI